MGHAEPASGLCSIAKVIVAMERGFIPPNLHYNEPNPYIPGLVDGRLQVQFLHLYLIYLLLFILLNQLVWGASYLASAAQGSSTAITRLFTARHCLPRPDLCG